METARAVFQQGEPGDMIELDNTGITCGGAFGTIFALLYRSNGAWLLKQIVEPAHGRNFQDSYKDVLSSLATVMDPVLLAKCRASMTKTFNMKKNDVCELPPELFMSGEDIFVGLGWDSRCDLDSAIIISDKDAAEGARAINVVNFRDKTFGQAVIHNGDNQTGQGSGDDERINVDLDYMPDEVKVLWVVVNIFTEGQSFEQVKGAYIRLCAARNGHPLCEFKLTEGSVRDNGLVLAKIFRNPANRWCVKAVGRGCGGRTARDINTLKICGISGPELSSSEIARIESQASQRRSSEASQ